jgi:hypothetical protein
MISPAPPLARLPRCTDANHWQNHLLLNIDIGEMAILFFSVILFYMGGLNNIE